MTQQDPVAARPPGWIGRTPGYGLMPSTDPLPTPRAAAPPPRWLFHAVCSGGAFWLLWKDSSPVPTTFAGLGTAMLLSAAAMVWLVRLAVAMIQRAPVSPWWAIAPLGGLFTLLLLATDAPLHARFAHADGRLAEIARSVSAASDPAVAATGLGDLGRVGTYRVSEVQTVDGAVYFTFRGGPGFEHSAGVAFVPDPAAVPVIQRTVAVEHIRGPWYAWYGSSFD